MKKISLIIIGLLLISGAAYARTFGCFAGVLGAPTNSRIDVVYDNHELFYSKKSSTELLPFLGCGVSFDF